MKFILWLKKILRIEKKVELNLFKSLDEEKIQEENEEEDGEGEIFEKEELKENSDKSKSGEWPENENIIVEEGKIIVIDDKKYICHKIRPQGR